MQSHRFFLQKILIKTIKNSEISQNSAKIEVLRLFRAAPLRKIDKNRCKLLKIKFQIPVKVRTVHSDRDRHKGEDSSEKHAETALQSQKCNIPKLEINGSEVINFFKTHAPLECQKKNSIEDNWVFINDEAIIRFTEKRAKAKCKIQYFSRVDDNNNKYEEPVEVLGEKIEENRLKLN